jgi:putative glutamine amidotransferase
VKPLIGITIATIRDRDWCPPFAGHRQTYVDAIVAAGGAPVLIPLVSNETALRTLYEQLDGVLLAGGGDIHPSLYGEEATGKVGMIDELRDTVELPLVRWADADHKPVLGICRGQQMINVALGGTLHQDIPSDFETDLVHDLSYKQEDWTYFAHDLRLDSNSQLANMLGVTTFPVNSLHHQSVKRLAPGLKAVGWAPDGVIEAIEGTNGHFIVGVQCHPEALQATTDERWRAMFGTFVAYCAEYRKTQRAVVA